jgi:hypothetical protein
MSGFAGLSRSRNRKPEGSTSSGCVPNSRKVCAGLVAGQAALTAEVRDAGIRKLLSRPRSLARQSDLPGVCPSGLRCGLRNGLIAWKAHPRTKMKIHRIAKVIFLLTTLTFSVRAQEIASKDLLRPPVVSSPMPSIQTEEKPEYPKGCSDMGVIYANGVTLDEDKKPRKLGVELVKISTKKLARGSEIIATAKLQNIGSKSVQIPWSTDFRTTMEGRTLTTVRGRSESSECQFATRGTAIISTTW